MPKKGQVVQVTTAFGSIYRGTFSHAEDCGPRKGGGIWYHVITNDGVAKRCRPKQVAAV